MSPFFSIVIPLYNKESYISTTLNTVLNQSFQDFEIVIVNDGSTDQSVSVINTFTDKRIQLIHQQNKGVSVARNTAIKSSTGTYIATLDGDDLWKENHLEELKKCIMLFKNAVLYCNNYEIKRHDGFVTAAKFNFDYNSECLIVPDFFEANIINYIPHSSSVAFKKDIFFKIGAYNTQLHTGQDIDLWIRFGLHGVIAFNPTITMLYNFFDPNSLSNSKLNDNRLLLINNYVNEEHSNPSLKRYMDIKRYALAIRYKFNNEDNKATLLIKAITIDNLNLKQRLILYCPKFALIAMKKFQDFLIRKNIYLSAFK
ncbi:glycosyltransferase family 2 protein [Olleya sp. Bg11-27]|uniref:glycosyltransferase family 2 protein n=1 Tax=Olleya sp. Bg11-27 TaxID=2058135 RepID=UPI000C315E4D|nr:glycosyltransferase [Olleya sp. Bg11-27]AUC77516.1 glycosyltransferase family 2 protein [Olleya sp. Bg11-27]